MKKSKTFCLTVLGLVLAALIGTASVIAAVPELDPFFVAHGLSEEDTALFSNHRYEMPGLIRNQDYSAVLIGTSLVANHRASWYTEGLGKKTLKIAFPDGWPTEFDTALDLAWATHPQLETVYFGLDLHIMIRPDSQRDVELPDYLYNTDPLANAAYYWNKETYIEAAMSMIQRVQGRLQHLDDAYRWEGDGFHVFSREQCLQSYERPAERKAPAPEDEFLPAVRENLAVVTSWLEEHPDVDFTIWFAPYSILFWDYWTREGKAEAFLSALQVAFETLTQYENVSLYCFLGREDIVTDLDNFTDLFHCSGDISRLEAEEMMAGRDPVTAENCSQRLEALRTFLAGYDYDAIFEQPQD